MRRLAALFAVVAISSGCGRGPSCSAELLAEYQQVNYAAGAPIRRLHAESALRMARAFRAKYSGVRCMAQRAGAATEPTLVVLDVNAEMDRLIAKLSRQRALGVSVRPLGGR
jgi:hypothetical protein